MAARLQVCLEIFGRFMSRVWLTVLYFTLVLPWGVVARLRAGRAASPRPAWSARPEATEDMTKARRQF